jgi:DNA polymerase I-like protein with 3'-5' exonuclease and polymerase domains
MSIRDLQKKQRVPPIFAETEADARHVLEQLEQHDVPVAVDTEFAPDGEIILVQFSWGRNVRLIVTGEHLHLFKEILEDKRRKFVYQNYKADALSFRNHGINSDASFHADIWVMSWLCDETQKRHGLKDQCRRYLHWHRKEYSALFCYVPAGKKKPVVVDPRVVMYGPYPDDMLAVRSPEAWRTVMLEYAGDDAESTIALYWRHRRQLEEEGYWPTYLRLDRRFTLTLMKCQDRGILIDTPYLRTLRRQVGMELLRVKHVFRAIAGRPEFNLNSNNQLQQLFFDDLAWPHREDLVTPKGNPKLNAEALTWFINNFEEGSPDFRLAEILDEYKVISKLQGGFIVPILGGVRANERLYSDFNQIGTSTGRISSRKEKKIIRIKYTLKNGTEKEREKTIRVGANLQNITTVRKDPTVRRDPETGEIWKDPTTGEVEGGVRTAFIAPKEGQMTCHGFLAPEPYVLHVNDMTGFELYMGIYNAAKYSPDSEMLKAARTGANLHALTAWRMGLVPKAKRLDAKAMIANGDWKAFKKLLGDVLYDIAKRCNFNLLYGGRARMLARLLGMNYLNPDHVAKAQRYIDAWMESWPEMPIYQRETVRHGYEHGYVETISGRRVHVKEGLSTIRDCDCNRYGCGICYERQKVERICMNYPCQGCLASRCKILTREGYVPIGEASETGEVWTGTSWKRYTKLDRGEWELAELRLKNGHVIKCDTRHKVLTQTEGGYVFKHYDDLEAGDRVCMSLARPLEFGTDYKAFDVDFYWLGFGIGNGCSRHGEAKPNGFTMSFGDRKGRYTKEDKAQAFIDYVQTGWQRETQKPQIHENKIAVGVGFKEFRDTYEKLGYPWGANSHEKTIPSIVWKVCLKQRKAFLVGLLDADGYVGERLNGPPYLHMCNEALLQEVQTLLRTCGVESYLRQTETGWRLELNGGQAAKHLSYGHERLRSTVTRMPAPRFVVTDFLSRTTSRMLRSQSYKVLHSRLKRGGAVSVYTLRAMYKEAGIKPPEMYATSELVEKKALGVKEPTYTLSVDSPLHRFDGEGVIHKNSAADIIKAAMNLIEADEELKRLFYGQLSQVHDELIGEGPLRTAPQCKEIVQGHMKTPYRDRLGFELPVEGGYNIDWMKAK